MCTKKIDGILGAINTGIQGVDEDVVIQLGDEYYENPRYYGMFDIFKENDCVFGVVKADEQRIRNNYSVEFKGDNIVRFVEKPKEVVNDCAGTGLVMIKKGLLKKLTGLYHSGKFEMVDFLNMCVETKVSIKQFDITDFYVNINTITDLNLLTQHLDENAKKYFFDDYYELYTLHRDDILIEQYYQGKFAEVYEAMCNIQSDGEKVVSGYGDSIYFEEMDIYKRYLAECRGSNILELACGSGRVTIRLACDRINITGVDNSQMMLDILTNKMNLEHKKFRKYIKIINDDITKLKKVNQRFDIVIFPATTIRLVDVDLTKFLNHIYQFVKPGGFFIFDIVEPKGKMNDSKIWTKYSMMYDINSVKNIMFFEERHDFNAGKTQVNFYVNEFGEDIKHYLSYTYLNLIDRARVEAVVKNTEFKEVVFEKYVDDKSKTIFFCVLKKNETYDRWK